MIHQYRNNGYNIVMDVYSGSVHVVDDVCYDVIAEVNKSETEPTAGSLKEADVKEKLLQTLGNKYETSDIEDALSDVIELTEGGQLFVKDTYECMIEEVKKRKTVVKALCLHIAHDCNLACKYCFAEEGEYHGRRALMSYEVGKKALDFLIKNSGNRRNLEVDFFGGEPLMNWQVAKDLVAYGREQEKIHNKHFRFTITTNGVLLNDEIQEFVNKEMDNVVLSLDGRKEINDQMRPFRNGKGSYERIAHFIHTIQEKTNVKIQYEATYTQLHIDHNYSHEDISKFMDQTFGIEGVVVNDQELSLQLLLDLWNSIDLEYLKRTELKYLPKDFWLLLHAIVHNTSTNICPVIDQYLAVSTDGTIYACHTINGIKECKLGSIDGYNVYNYPELYKPFDHEIDFRSNEKCEKCWAQRLCGGCTVHRFFNHKINQFEAYPNEDFCKITLLCIEQILLIIASIRKDPQLWSLLIQKMNN